MNKPRHSMTRAQSMRRAWKRPATRRRMTEAARAVWTPAKRAAHSAILREINKRPGQHSKRIAAAKHSHKEQDKVERTLRQQGWQVLRRGWPDFLCTKGRRVRFIEAKAGRAPLTVHQRRVCAVLERFGIKVEVIRS